MSGTLDDLLEREDRDGPPTERFFALPSELSVTLFAPLPTATGFEPREAISEAETTFLPAVVDPLDDHHLSQAATAPVSPWFTPGVNLPERVSDAAVNGNTVDAPLEMLEVGEGLPAPPIRRPRPAPKPGGRHAATDPDEGGGGDDDRPSPELMEQVLRGLHKL